MSIEEAIEEINRRSIKLSAVSKGALISSQNFAVASYPGYTVTYTAAPSTHSTQPPVAGSWVKSINLSTLCPEVENIKLGTFLVCLGVYFRLVDNSICSHQHKRSLYNTINTKRRIGVTTLASCTAEVSSLFKDRSHSCYGNLLILRHDFKFYSM